MRILAIAMLLLGFNVAASAQQQPYAGFQNRSIKALSAQQIDDLRNARGMGLAMAAELNGYPGPVHVLQLAAALKLNENQHRRANALYEAMKAEATPLGEQLIAREAELDRLFADKAVTADKLEKLTQSIAATQGALRNAHLKYHLLMLDALSSEQVRQYAALRGYTNDAGPGVHHHGRH